jgi:hypothetical protein
MYLRKMSMTTITKICTRVGDKTLCEHEMSRKPYTVRKIEAKYFSKETVKFLPVDFKYEDTAYAKMEAERRPRAAARMNKLKK